MPNIVLTRIDNRLVHGQVATQWCGAIGANLILVANDEVAGNSLRQGLMNMAAPAYAAMRYWTVQKTIDTIHKASAKQLIFIVCENPQDVVKLVEGGVPIKKVNIGNMHMAEGKRQVAGSVAVDDADVAAFKRLQELGVELEIRRVPTEHAENIEKLFKYAVRVLSKILEKEYLLWALVHFRSFWSLCGCSSSPSTSLISWNPCTSLSFPVLSSVRSWATFPLASSSAVLTS